MNQISTSGTSSYPAPELHFWRDWKDSFSPVIQAMITSPIALILLGIGILLEFFGIPFVPSMIISVASLFIVARVIRLTCCKAIPGSFPSLFPQKPELRMFCTQWLIGLGTTFGMLFFIVPGIWFALVHALATEFIVVENCSIFEALSRSRQLMKGNIWRFIGYTWGWPIVINIGMLIVLAIVAFPMYMMIGANGSDAVKDILKHVLMGTLVLVSMPFGFTVRSLYARAFLTFMHDAGQPLAIEQQLSSVIAKET